MQVKMHAAKSQLSKLVEAAERGKEVVLARGNMPVARIVAIIQKPFRYGSLADELKGPTLDFEPIGADDLDQWDREENERIERGSS